MAAVQSGPPLLYVWNGADDVALGGLRRQAGSPMKLAEREGFEPSMGCPIPHFQCGALGL
jgi:hypothetical protein